MHNVTLVCADGSNSCCDTRQIAQDSVLLWSVPAPARTTWLLSSVGRLDLAVKCSSEASLVWASGSIRMTVVSTSAAKYVRAINRDEVAASVACRRLRPHVDRDGNCVRVYVDCGSADTPLVDGMTAWTPVRPDHLTSLTAATVSAANTHTVAVRHDRSSPDATSIQIVWDGVFQTWDPLVPADTITFGSIQQLNIGLGHPFHLHMYNMQVSVSAAAADSGSDMGHWSDASIDTCRYPVVNTAPASSSCAVHVPIIPPEVGFAVSIQVITGCLSTSPPANWR